MNKEKLLDVLSFINEITSEGPLEICQKSKDGLYLFFNKHVNSFCSDFGIKILKRDLCIIGVGTKMSEDQIKKVEDAFDMKFKNHYKLEVIKEKHNVGREYTGHVFINHV